MLTQLIHFVGIRFPHILWYSEKKPKNGATSAMFNKIWVLTLQLGICQTWTGPSQPVRSSVGLYMQSNQWKGTIFDGGRKNKTKCCNHEESPVTGFSLEQLEYRTFLIGEQWNLVFLTFFNCAWVSINNTLSKCWGFLPFGNTIIWKPGLYIIPSISDWGLRARPCCTSTFLGHLVSENFTHIWI